MIKDFLCGYGPETPRWGGKVLWLCTDQKCVDKINDLWPNTKWIICIRHAFISCESQKNTFVKKMNLELWIKRWINSVKFLEKNSGLCIQIDKLNKEDRKDKLNKILTFIGERPSKETERFINKWDIIHKVKNDEKRKFKLEENRKKEMLEKFDKLSYYMKKMGY